jgi:hypothetical protein
VRVYDDDEEQLSGVWNFAIKILRGIEKLSLYYEPISGRGKGEKKHKPSSRSSLFSSPIIQHHAGVVYSEVCVD